MSNTQATFGFQHIGYLPGYAPDMAPTRRMIQSTYATALFFGDPVIKSAASPYIAAAITTGTVTALAGIFQGCFYVPKGQSGAPVYSQWFPGQTQTDATALVIDSPGAIFRVAAANTAVPATAVGNNISWSTGAGGTTFGAGYSSYSVNFDSIGTSSSLQFTIVDMWSNRVGSTGNGVDNANPFNWVVVGFNNEWLRAGQTGVA